MLEIRPLFSANCRKYPFFAVVFSNKMHAPTLVKYRKTKIIENKSCFFSGFSYLSLVARNKRYTDNDEKRRQHQTTHRNRRRIKYITRAHCRRLPIRQLFKLSRKRCRIHKQANQKWKAQEEFSSPRLTPPTTMKEQIEKLTEAQAKLLLDLAMIWLKRSVFAETHAEKLTAATYLGLISAQIETLAKSNKEQ